MFSDKEAAHEALNAAPHLIKGQEIVVELETNPRCQVFVGGLDSQMREEEVVAALAIYGRVIKCKRPSRDGRHAMFAFATFSSVEEANIALQAGSVCVNGRSLVLKPPCKNHN